MADPVELANAIVAHIGALGPEHAEALGNSKGYAFQAYVFTVVGDRLSEAWQWEWQHPKNGLPRFALGNKGGALPDRVAKLSYLAEPGGQALLAQGVTVSGRSTATHDLDVVAIAGTHTTVLNAHGSGLPSYPGASILVAAIECKNEDANQSMDTAREQVGLTAEIGALPVHLGPVQGVVVGAHLVLVSASGVTPNAERLLGAYGIRSFVGIEVDDEAGWVEELADNIAFHCQLRHNG